MSGALSIPFLTRRRESQQRALAGLDSLIIAEARGQSYDQAEAEAVFAASGISTEEFEQAVVMAKRRDREAQAVVAGHAAAAKQHVVDSRLVSLREEAKAAHAKVDAKYGPQLSEAEAAVRSGSDAQAKASRAHTFLIESAPAHVSEPLAECRRQLVRAESYLSNNRIAHDRLCALLETAQRGELPVDEVMQMIRPRQGGDPVFNDRKRTYNADIVDGLKSQVRDAKSLLDHSLDSLARLRRIVDGLEKLQLQPWPSRASVQEILGPDWMSLKPADREFISTAFGTPAASRVG